MEQLPDLLSAITSLWRRTLSAVAAPGTPLSVLESAAGRLAGLLEPRLSDALTSALVTKWLLGGRDAALAAPLAVSPLPGSWPVRSAAASWLARRKVLSASDYDRLSADARSSAISISRSASAGAAKAFRDALERDLTTGGTLTDFRKAVASAAGSAGLSRANVETLYRDNVGRAYAAGRAVVLNHPLVASHFPYRMWVAIHDSRAEDSHLRMELNGLNGTGVYRADDRLFLTHTPPCRYRCRCSVIPLTVRMAAEEGVKEAARWLETGQRPRPGRWLDPKRLPDQPADWVPTPSAGGPF